jgi:hypothetical protein
VDSLRLSSNPGLLGVWLCAVVASAGCADTLEFEDTEQTGFEDGGADLIGDGDAGPDLDPDLPAADVRTDPNSDATEPDIDDTADVPDIEPDAPPDTAPRFTRYFQEQPLSPITEAVAEEMREIRAASDTPDDLVFMKVGASGTVSRNLLYCFGGGDQYALEWAGRDHFHDTVEFFRMGDAGGDTPFDRDTEAAVVGRTARWVISGDPSPLEREIEAINPRFAFVNYGTNDMGGGSTYASALPPFYENFSALMDQLIARGIIPIITGLNPRSDRVGAARWVATYNTVVRGVAEALQIPFIDIYLVSKELAGLGLLGDGLHGNVYRAEGRSQPCWFGDDGLEYNYNHRNLLSIQGLHHVRRTVLEGAPAPDDRGLPPLQGQGSPSTPIIIDGLPFTHVTDTRGGTTEWDEYPSCDRGQDESGPEVVYELTLEEATPLRLGVLDRGTVDIDIHLLSGPGTEDCLVRHDRLIEGTFAAGRYLISLDSYVSNGEAHQGEYLFFALRCEDGDPDCDQ